MYLIFLPGFRLAQKVRWIGNGRPCHEGAGGVDTKNYRLLLIRLALACIRNVLSLRSLFWHQDSKPGAVYDYLQPREFLLPPLWSIVVVWLYTIPRVDCKYCEKVIVEQVPWSTGRSPVTKQFAAFLACDRTEVSTDHLALLSFSQSTTQIFLSISLFPALLKFKTSVSNPQKIKTR